MVVRGEGKGSRGESCHQRREGGPHRIGTPPPGVVTRMQLGLASISECGIASAGAMGSFSAWIQRSGTRTSGMERELLEPA